MGTGAANAKMNEWMCRIIKVREPARERLNMTACREEVVNPPVRTVISWLQCYSGFIIGFTLTNLSRRGTDRIGTGSNLRDIARVDSK
jgi:hypothetical protein